MSTQKTANYQLNQWVKSDRILMEEFNADNLKIDDAIAAVIPTGLICLWSGVADALPAGWALCNGSNGTPDLRGRFLVGAGGSYAVGDTGGAASETLKQFNHTGGSWVEDLWAYGKDNSTHDNRPPYYALCYIMKL